jgi:6-phosphogluconolactonase
MGMKFQWVRRAPDLDGLAQLAASEVLQLSHEAITERGAFRVALVGGSTPRTMYELLSGSTTARFDRWHFYWGDERFVPADDERSNFLMAQQTLLGRISLSDHQIHRVRTEAGSPSTVAADYEEELRYSFETPRDEIPRFDLVLLGLGEDGHTASLFPNSPLLEDHVHLVGATWVESLHQHRISLTMSVINEARAVIFMVSGASKAEALKDVLEGRGKPEERPARMVSPRDGTVLWIVDEEAASGLVSASPGGGPGSPRQAGE